MLRFGQNWETLGERPTKYFLNLEKHNFVNKTIYRLKDKKGVILTEENKIWSEIKNYYEDLYSSKNVKNNDYLNKLDIPKISEEIKTELEGDITMKEMGQALFSMPNSKCPGTDGLPPNFYKVFYPKIKDLLFNTYVEIVKEKQFHLARKGIISLLEKPSAQELLLKGWRPLSLLNTANKIFTKILATRMEKAMQTVIHESQTGFMKGRYMAEGLMRIQEVMHYSHRGYRLC